MSKNVSNGRFLRWLGIIFMGLTAGFTLLGGVGTSCVAFNPTGFSESMAKLASMQWLYVLFVVLGIALGVLGMRATIQLVKGADRAYQNSLVVLLLGLVVGVVHILVSRSLRGKSMPVDAIVYTTVLTLVIFLIFRIPSIWRRVDFSRGDAKSNTPAGSAALILVGLLALTIQYSMGPTHTWDSVNYADAFNLSMSLSGTAFLLTGFGLLIRSRFAASRVDQTLNLPETTLNR